jgi:SAM-dependent methyltransferase
MQNENNLRAAEYWDENVQIREKPAARNIHWLNSRLAGKYHLNKLKIGNKTMSIQEWLPWVKEKYVPETLEYGLSLGCGDGALERHALSLGICKRFDAFDLSSRSVNIAIEERGKRGFSDKLHYEVKDINSIALENDKYDIVFLDSSMHHFRNLEHVIMEIRKSLKKNGLLIANEFVGPSQFQWTDKQLQIMNELLPLLPPRLCHDIMTNAQKIPIGRPSIEHMNTHDPSEAIRSAEIIPLLEEYFEIVERTDFGGTLLHLLLQGIIENFDPAREEDISILRLLGYIEDVLIREGVLSSDFTFLVLKNNKGLIVGKAKWFFRKYRDRIINAKK